MRNILLICLTIFIGVSCKNDKTGQQVVELKVPGKNIEKSPTEVDQKENTPIVEPEVNTVEQIEQKPVPPPKKIQKKTPPKKQRPKSVKKQKASAQKPMSIIKFDKPIFDFGEITEGDIIDHDFHFENTGNAPLQILEADATCGCATPEIPFLDIAPGQKSKIHVTYNSVNKEGYETPSITIKTNGAPTYYKLKLQGTIKPRKESKVKADNLPVGIKEEDQ